MRGGAGAHAQGPMGVQENCHWLRGSGSSSSICPARSKGGAMEIIVYECLQHLPCSGRTWEAGCAGCNLAHGLIGISYSKGDATEPQEGDVVIAVAHSYGAGRADTNGAQGCPQSGGFRDPSRIEHYPASVVFRTVPDWSTAQYGLQARCILAGGGDHACPDPQWLNSRGGKTASHLRTYRRSKQNSFP